MAVLKRIGPASAFQIGIVSYAFLGLIAGVFCSLIVLTGASFAPHAHVPFAPAVGIVRSDLVPYRVWDHRRHCYLDRRAHLQPCLQLGWRSRGRNQLSRMAPAQLFARFERSGTTMFRHNVAVLTKSCA